MHYSKIVALAASPFLALLGTGAASASAVINNSGNVVAPGYGYGAPYGYNNYYTGYISDLNPYNNSFYVTNPYGARTLVYTNYGTRYNLGYGGYYNNRYNDLLVGNQVRVYSSPWNGGVRAVTIDRY